MQRIFKDERRRIEALSTWPRGLWPKSALATSQSLESVPHFPCPCSLRQQILLQTVIHTELVRVAYS